MKNDSKSVMPLVCFALCKIGFFFAYIYSASVHYFNQNMDDCNEDIDQEMRSQKQQKQFEVTMVTGQDDQNLMIEDHNTEDIDVRQHESWRIQNMAEDDKTQYGNENENMASAEGSQNLDSNCKNTCITEEERHLRSTNTDNAEVFKESKTDTADVDEQEQYDCMYYESCGDEISQIGEKENVSVFCIDDEQELGFSEAKRRRIDISDRNLACESESETPNKGKRDLDMIGQNTNCADQNGKNKQRSGIIIEDSKVITIVDDAGKTCGDEIDKIQRKVTEISDHCMTTNSELDKDRCTQETANNDDTISLNVDSGKSTIKDENKCMDTTEKQSEPHCHSDTRTHVDNKLSEKQSESIEIIYSRLDDIVPVASDLWIEEHSEFHPLSDIPILHLSMIMGLIYPKRWASNAVTMQYCKPVERDLKSSLNTPDSAHQGVLTGSMSQGLTLPIMTIVDQNGRVLDEESPDIDIMFLNKNMCVAYSSENLRTVGIIETEQTRTGYLRLLVLNETSIAEPFKIRDPENGKWYFNSSCVLGRFMATAKKNQNINEDTHEMTSKSGVSIDISTHGPALMVTDTRTVGKVPTSRWNDTDSVFGFPCIDWPQVAHEWTIRERPNNWPPKDKLIHMCSLNCEVVGVPHKLSEKPEIEWRFSFTSAEKCITNECVTSAQRHCYMVLKILYNAKLKGHGLLCSFDLKSIFFRSCEKIPLKLWVDKPGACLLYMIDMLIFHVRQRFLPYYFIEGRNLLDHLGENMFRFLEQKLCLIRQNPVTVLQEFSKRHKFIFTPIFFGMESVFKPLLSDIEGYQKLNDIGRTSSAYTTGAITLATCHFLERRNGESFNILNDAKELVESFEIPGTKIQSIYSMVVAVITQFPKRRTQAIEFLKHAIKSLSLSSYNLLPDLYGTLALWLHRHACDLQIGTERDNATTQAEQNFVESLRLQIPNPFVDLEYSHFLIYQDRHCEAIPYLMNVIDNERENPTCYNVYTAADIMSVEKGIREAVDSHNGEFIVPSLSLAYFFLIKCYMKIEEKDEMISVTEQMSSTCNQLNSETSTFLLNLSKK